MTSNHVHETVPFHRSHLNGINWVEKRRFGRISLESALKQYESNPAWSELCNGSLVIAYGVVIPFRGLGETWAILGPAARQHTKLLHKSAREALACLVPPGTRRLQAMVVDGFTAGHRWVERLGFEREAVLKRYGVAGEDMVVYAMFPEASEC